jgi:hypothetical protein
MASLSSIEKVTPGTSATFNQNSTTMQLNNTGKRGVNNTW